MKPMKIYPYQLPGGQWCFDDPETGLKEEFFVSGADTAISRIVQAKQLSNAANGFEMTFNDASFPGYDVELSWSRQDEIEGNWYEGDIAGQHLDLWLCPALFHYFESAPRKIYVRCSELPAGVTPIWNDRGQGKRYVGPP